MRHGEAQPDDRVGVLLLFGDSGIVFLDGGEVIQLFEGHGGDDLVGGSAELRDGGGELPGEKLAGCVISPACCRALRASASASASRSSRSRSLS